MSALQVTDTNFEEEVLKSDKPVLVDFWAEWCGPCRALLPTVETIAAEQSDKIKVIKMNVDENPESPGKYEVRSIPALFIFKNGEVISQKSGALPKAELEKWIEETIK